MKNELQNILKKEVSIGQISGNLFKSATVTDIKIAENKYLDDGIMIEIKELHANYNLITALKKRGDISAATSEATIDNVKLFINRSKEDKWNILHLFPPPPPGEKPNPATFTGLLTIKKLDIFFTDKKGWGPKKIKIPFTEHFANLKGSMNYKNLLETTLDLSGIIASSGSPLNINGLVNIINGQYNLSFTAQPSINKWSFYILPYKGYRLTGKDPTISGTIQSKNPFPIDKIPFFYDIDIPISHLNFQIPFFKNQLKRVKGKVKMSHGIVSFNDLKETLNKPTKITDSVWKTLIQANIISELGKIKRIPSKSHVLIKKFPDLLPLLKNPKQILILSPINTSIGKIPLTGKGLIYLDKGKLTLKFNSKTFETQEIKDLFPILKSWKFEGLGTTNVTISGYMDNPLTIGLLEIKDPSFFGLKPKNVRLKYQFYNDFLDIHILKGSLYDGQLSGVTTINLKKSPATFKAYLKIKDLDANTILKHPSPLLRGHVNLSSTSHGPMNNFHTRITLDSDELHIINQLIPSGNISL